MTKSTKMLFAAALMLSVATAWDDIENILNEDPANAEEFWQPAEHEYEPPEHYPKKHEPFPANSDERAVKTAFAPEGHHVGDQHDFDIKMHISDKQPHQEALHLEYDHEEMIPRDHAEQQLSQMEEWGDGEDKPYNYFYEEPVAPPTAYHLQEAQRQHRESHHESHHEPHHEPHHEQHFEEPRKHPEPVHLKERSYEETQQLEKYLADELKNRHLGHKFVEKRPLFVQSRLSDLNETELHSASATQTVETLYDDLSVDRVGLTTEVDEMVDTNVTFLPSGEDGILKTFIERYTTMLIHDSIFMEELPAPHFMHHEISMLHPLIQGAMKHDPREQHHQFRDHSYESEYEREPMRTHHYEHAQNDQVELTLNDLLRESEAEGHIHPRGHLDRQPRDTYDIDKFYHVSQPHGQPIEVGAHHGQQHANGVDLHGEDAHEGARHLRDTLAMHFVQPEDMQMLHRELESGHRHERHAPTRYSAEHFSDHRVSRDHDDDPHYWEMQRHHEDEHAEETHDLIHSHHMHGLPVHDQYGERAIEHHPFHHEYVHGTNYELGSHHSAPVVEHNPHAFASPSKDAKPSHKGDVTPIAPPKEVIKESDKKSDKKSAKKEDKAAATKQIPSKTSNFSSLALY